MFYSRIQAKKALKTFDVHDYYIESALIQYEVCNILKPKLTFQIILL